MDTETFLTMIAVMTGVGFLWAMIYKLVQWLERQKEQDKEIQKVISFDTFSGWVDEALEQMRGMLEQNQDLQKYVGTH